MKRADIMKQTKSISALALCAVIAVPALAESPVRINQAMQKAAEKAASDINISPDLQQRIMSLQMEMQGEAWQARLHDMEAQAAGVLGIAKEFNAAAAKEAESPAQNHDRLYVFVSHSMPIETVRRYAANLEKIPGGVMVLRGFVGGGREMAPTARFIADVLKKDPECEGKTCEMRNVEVLIDPILFKRHNISRVPAVVFAENVENIGHCQEGTEHLPPATNAIFGDAGLGYAVARLNKETPRPGLTKLQKLLGD